MQQLYIRGVAVDMPAEEIKIKVASNILSDADKIMTAHSYNVALPRTMTNDNVFALAYVPAAETGGNTTHRYLTASLYVDDVPLFVDGQAVLTSVDDKGYNLTLLWGVLGVFDEIKREGLKVCELPLSVYWSESNAQWLTLAQNNQPIDEPYNSGMNAIIYGTLDSASKTEADTHPWWMPADTAVNILTKIAAVYGIAIDYSMLASQRLAKLTHIATTLRTMCKGEEVGWWTYSVLRSLGNNKYYIEWFNNNGATADNVNIWQNALKADTNGVYVAQSAVHFKSVRVYGYRTRDDFWLVFPKAPDNEVQINPTYNSQTKRWEIDHTWYEAQLEAGDTLPFFSTHHDGVPSEQTQFRMEVVIDEVGEAVVGQRWEYTRNAPDVSIIKYISECLAHIGGFIVGSVSKADRLRVMTFDEVAQATPIEYELLGVKSIAMTFGNLARKNIYQHTENKDDEAQGMPSYTAEGYISTNDNTLQVERTAFKSEFKVPRTNKILHWEVAKNENANNYKATWHDAGKYVLGFDVTFHYYNTGQDFGRTLANYYGEYQRVVTYPKAIEVIVRLSVVQLMQVDFTRPIYIEQLGRQYLIESIETESNNRYKFKLVQI